MRFLRSTLTLASIAWLAAAPAGAERLRYPIEANHSTVGFSVPIFAGFTRVTGKFNEYDVTIHYDEADLSTASVEAIIKVASIDTGIEMRDKDLMGEAFFDIANHPEITFVSRSVKKRGEGYVAVGDFTMRGVTKTVELPFRLAVHRYDEGDQMLGVKARLTLDRNDYGVGAKWKHTTMENFLGTEIAVEIDLWTRTGKPETAQ